MKTLDECIKNRRSVRKYRQDPVPRDLIAQVIEAGLLAASGKNKQSPVVIAVTRGELIEKMRKLNAAIHGTPDADTFYGAPAVLIVASSKKANEATAVYDGSLTLGNMMLKAYDLGLGSCWIHRAKQSLSDELYKEIFRSVGLDADDFEGVGHLILGYADGEYPKAPARREGRAFFIE